MRKFILTMAALATLTACDKAAVNLANTDLTNGAIVAVQGVVVDDYVSGSEVTIKRGPSAPSDTDYHGLADENGQFNLNVDASAMSEWDGRIYSIGGINRLTSGNFNSQMVRLLDSANVLAGNLQNQQFALTPLSTLVAKMNGSAAVNKLAQCIMGSNATADELVQDYISGNQQQLAVVSMKLQKTVEIAQEAIQKAISEYFKNGSRIPQVDKAAIAANLYSKIAEQVNAAYVADASTFCVNNKEPISVALESDAVVNTPVFMTDLGMSSAEYQTFTQTTDVAQPISVQTVASQSGSVNAQVVLSAIKQVATQIDAALAQASAASVTKVLISSELMSNQAIRILDEVKNAGETDTDFNTRISAVLTEKVQLASQLLTTTETFETNAHDLDFDGLSTEVFATTEKNFTAALASKSKIGVVFSSSLANQYLKTASASGQFSVYFFDDSHGYACFKNNSNAMKGYKIKYKELKKNALLIDVVNLQTSGVLTINQDANSNLTAKVNIGSLDYKKDYVLTPAETADYATFSETATPGVKQIALKSFSAMNASDQAALNVADQSANCDLVQF